MIVGRKSEMAILTEWGTSYKSELIVVYGRRRVGKSFLIKETFKKSLFLKFDGLENETTMDQIRQFQESLKKQLPNPLLKSIHFTQWNQIFDYLTDHFSREKKKTIILLDELQWMAANQTKLISLIKFYWDNYWKDQNVLIILCGSIASFMVKKVLHSKALYGRITGEMNLKKLLPHEAQLLISRRGEWERLKYLILLGGVPKYLELIKQNKSFDENIKKLFFEKDSALSNEHERIFYSHFREPKTYLRIIHMLLGGPMSLEEIAQKMKVPSGGRLKDYINNLMLADFIREQKPFSYKKATKLIKYRIADEYLFFFSKYIYPHLNLIKSDGAENLFTHKISHEWRPWLGFAFENYCMNNAMWLADQMGFKEKVETFGSLIKRKSPGVQIDLIFKRIDKVLTVCEMKFSDKPVGTKVVLEMQKKISMLEIPKGWTAETALISPLGADKSVMDLKYFHHIVTMKHFVRK